MALSKGAHLAVLKAMDQKAPDLYTQVFLRGHGLRIAGAEGMLGAEHKLWHCIAGGGQYEYSLDKAPHEMTNIRSGLLQARARMYEPPPHAPQPHLPHKGNGKGWSVYDRAGNALRHPFTTTAMKKLLLK